MSDLNVQGIDHVNITAPEELVNEVSEWYETTLQLERIEKPEGTRSGGAWFKAGAQEVHLSVDPHNPPQTAHFGIVVDEVSAVIERLRSSGCHIEQAGSIPGRHRFYTRDPAGNRIEVVSFDRQGSAG